MIALETPFPPDGPLLKRCHAFWLVVVLEVMLLLFLAYELKAALQQKARFGAFRDSQIATVEQADKFSAGVQSWLQDLFQLSASDPQAKVLVDKYHIKGGK